MTINKKLTQLYKENWNELHKKVATLSNEEKPTNPLLLKISNEEAYLNSDFKVMIVGKETYDWGDVFGAYDIKGLQDLYASFLSKSERTQHSLFWRYSRKFLSSLKDKTEGEVTFVWNNINKLGRVGQRGTPSKLIRDIQKESFDVFEDELKILKPNIVLFLTGPSYDSTIKTYLPGLTFQKYPEGTLRQVAKCMHPELHSSIALRTYHPMYLNTIKSTGKSFERNTPIDILLREVSTIS